MAAGLSTRRRMSRISACQLRSRDRRCFWSAVRTSARAAQTDRSPEGTNALMPTDRHGGYIEVSYNHRRRVLSHGPTLKISARAGEMLHLPLTG